MASSEPNAYFHIATGTTGNLPIRGTSTVTFPTILGRIMINTIGAGVLTVYDGFDATGSVIAVLDLGAITYNDYNVQCFRGLFVTKTGASDITITYN